MGGRYRRPPTNHGCSHSGIHTPFGVMSIPSGSRLTCCSRTVDGCCLAVGFGSAAGRPCGSIALRAGCRWTSAALVQRQTSRCSCRQAGGGMRRGLLDQRFVSGWLGRIIPRRPHRLFLDVSRRLDPISQSTCLRCQVQRPTNTTVTVASRMNLSRMRCRIVSVLALRSSMSPSPTDLSTMSPSIIRVNWSL